MQGAHAITLCKHQHHHFAQIRSKEGIIHMLFKASSTNTAAPIYTFSHSIHEKKTHITNLVSSGNGGMLAFPDDKGDQILN